MISNNGPIIVEETEFQELFELYWNTSEWSKERLYVINEVNKYIYHYLTTKNASDFDIASDFFIENFQKTKRLVEAYEPAYQISFLVYITSKIKRRFINFKIRKQKSKVYENINEFYEINPEIHNKSVFEPQVGYIKGLHSMLLKNVEACLSQLNQEEEISIKLYFCFMLSFRELRYLKKKFGNTLFLDHYREYISHVEEKISEEKNERGKLIKKLYTTNILIYENHESRILEKKNRLVSEFYRIKKPVPLRLIAPILKTSITSIHRKIKTGSEKIQVFFSNPELIQEEINSSREKQQDKRAA